jgi:anti-sigma B factor antagonist
MSTFEAVKGIDETGQEVLSVVGDVDLATAPKLVDAAAPWAESGALVRLDLDGVTFLDSTGVGALLQIRQTALGAGGQLELVNLSASVQRVLEITGLTLLLTSSTEGE